MSYANSSISEYISCKIFESIGIDVKQTMLGTYEVNGNTKIVVACKDLEKDGFVLKDFAHLKNTVITSEILGYSTDLEEILETIEMQNIVDSEELKSFFGKCL